MAPVQYSNLLVARATVLFCGCDGVGMRCGAFPPHRSHRVKYGMTYEKGSLEGPDYPLGAPSRPPQGMIFCINARISNHMNGSALPLRARRHLPGGGVEAVEQVGRGDHQ